MKEGQYVELHNYLENKSSKFHISTHGLFIMYIYYVDLV